MESGFFMFFPWCRVWRAKGWGTHQPTPKSHCRRVVCAVLRRRWFCSINATKRQKSTNATKREQKYGEGRKAPGIPTEYTVFSSQTTRLRARDEDQRRLSEDWPDGAKQRGGSGGSKPKKEKKKPPARALESDDGAKFMLFRVLMLANVPVSFARGSGNVAKLLSAAAHKGAMRARCGTDGRACRMPQAPLLGLEGAPLLARGRLPPS